MADVSLTWLGHASFRIDTPGGKRVYLDPWLDNPNCPDGEKEVERADVVALTHGHFDHLGNAAEIGKRHGSKLVAQFDLATWIESQGWEGATELGMNKGGTVDVDGLRFTMTHALHSSSTPDGGYGGEAAGYVVEFENGTVVYFAGDTAVFGDMQLIGRLHEPETAVLPIGGHFTMDPRQAALALELLGAKRCVPCHYGTMPVLTGTPDQLRELASGVEVLGVDPGETATV